MSPHKRVCDNCGQARFTTSRAWFGNMETFQCAFCTSDGSPKGLREAAEEEAELEAQPTGD